MSRSAAGDPYTSDAARWVRTMLAINGITVAVDERVQSAMAADREGRHVWLPPGHDQNSMIWWAIYGAMFIKGGLSWAPDMIQPNAASSKPTRHLSLIQGGAR